MSLKSIKEFFQSQTTWVFGILILVFLMVNIFQAINTGVTTDEYAHFGAIDSYVDGLGLNPEHPLGQKVLASWWYMLIRPQMDFDEVAETDQYYRGAVILSNPEIDSLSLIFSVRMIFVLTNMLFLVWLWYMVRKGWISLIFGISLGVIYTLSPSIFGHASLITFDVAGAASALMFILTLIFSYRHLEDWKKQPLGVLSLVYGLLFWALNTKYSNVIVGLPFGLWLVLVFWQLAQTKSLQLRYFLIWNVVMFLGLSVVIWSIYAWAFRNVPLEMELKNGQVYNIDYSSHPLWRPIWQVVEPWLRYIDGMLKTSSRSSDIQNPYLLGEYKNIPLLAFGWYIFWFKENTFLILGGLSFLGYWIYKVIRSQFWLDLRSKLKWNKLPIHLFLIAILLIYPLIYAYISANRYLVIGYRHLYPVLIFIYAGLAWLIEYSYRNINWKVFRVWSGLALVGFVLASLMSMEYGLSYVNNFYLGKRHEFVNDSSYNWGQAHRYAFRYMHAQNLEGVVGISAFPLSIEPQEQFRVEVGESSDRLDFRWHGFGGDSVSDKDYEYFILDSHVYQHITGDDFEEYGEANLDYLNTQSELVYNYQDVIWVYKVVK